MQIKHEAVKRLTLFIGLTISMRIDLMGNSFKLIIFLDTDE
jgi:hypothetical protein